MPAIAVSTPLLLFFGLSLTACSFIMADDVDTICVACLQVLARVGSSGSADHCIDAMQQLFDVNGPYSQHRTFQITIEPDDMTYICRSCVLKSLKDQKPLFETCVDLGFCHADQPAAQHREEKLLRLLLRGTIEQTNLTNLRIAAVEAELNRCWLHDKAAATAASAKERCETKAQPGSTARRPSALLEDLDTTLQLAHEQIDEALVRPDSLRHYSKIGSIQRLNEKPHVSGHRTATKQARIVSDPSNTRAADNDSYRDLRRLSAEEPASVAFLLLAMGAGIVIEWALMQLSESLMSAAGATKDVSSLAAANFIISFLSFAKTCAVAAAITQYEVPLFWFSVDHVRLFHSDNLRFLSLVVSFDAGLRLEALARSIPRSASSLRLRWRTLLRHLAFVLMASVSFLYSSPAMWLPGVFLVGLRYGVQLIDSAVIMLPYFPLVVLIADLSVAVSSWSVLLLSLSHGISPISVFLGVIPCILNTLDVWSAILGKYCLSSGLD